MNGYDNCLKADGLMKLLKDNNLISETNLHDRRNNVVTKLCVDMSKCDNNEFKKMRKHCIEHGVVDFAKKKTDGSYGVRRDLTQNEIDDIPYYPITFNPNNQDEIVWFSAYNSYDQVGFMISKKFPEKEFQYTVFYEGECDGSWKIKDGIFTQE